MIRLLIFLGILYFGYRAVKSWLLHYIWSQTKVSGESRTEIDDVMIKDPYCDIYFPKRDGVHLRIDGEDFYFCSAECRDKFLALRTKK